MPVMKKAADTLTTTTTTTTPLMEIGSGSVTESGSSNTSTNNETATSQSINGLKFGKKIYFEDHHRHHHHQRVGSSSSLSRSKKGRNQQPPRCQVEGCNVDLSDVKGYYSKHKVCISHSKSPTVVVAGLDQRFCQQCSRFHRLTEFDQGKRSCRRRLAGHNERRRKPQQASILSSRYARLASTVFDNSSQSGGFLLDFSAYARQTEKDAWRGTKPSQQAPGNQVTAAGGSITPFPWQDSSQNLSLYLQGSTGTSSSSIPPGECFTGVSLANANCALSLLSNTSWGSRTETSCLDINNLTNTEVASITQSTGPHGMAFNQYSDQHWSFKDDAAGFTSHELHPDLGLGQISQPLISQLSSEAELSQQNRRQYLLFDQSRDNDSATQSINWFL